VTLTTQGSEALKWIRDGERYDVVFCDVMMPEFNGMDMHARLKQLDPQLAANVVFMTGGAFTTRAQQFLENVENRVIEKPFDIRAVQALVASSALP
jgi:CheY-like chemotaxis protein